MKVLLFGANNEAIKELLIEWTELLAQEKYGEALDMFQSFNHDEQWTPELLEEVINGYGIAGYTKEQLEKELGRVCHITSLLDNPDKDAILENINIDFFNEEVTENWAKVTCCTNTDFSNIIGDIHYDCVPLDGKMSDLTGMFFIKKIDEQHFTLCFRELHVM